MAKGWLFGGDPSARRSRGRVQPLARAADMAQQYPLINPARLRNEIQFATASAAQDGFGQPVNTWTPYLTAWAEIRQLSGQELYQGDQWTSNAQFRITLRFPAGFTVNIGDRIFFVDPFTSLTHTYVVQIVDDLFMRHIALQLTCLEIDGSS